METFHIQTFGCKVNTYDTGLLQKRLVEAGYVLQSDHPKIHVLNTCAVTQEATREAIRTIRRLKAHDPFCTVVVTGCAAQVDTDAFEHLPGADLIVANSHKGFLEEILKQYYRGELGSKVLKSNIFHKSDLEEGGGVEADHTRAFIKIQDGCNSFCAYCIIPFARGKSRSLSMDELVRRIQDIHARGTNEVVLTGVHIGDYQDQAHRLEDLIEAILTRTKIPRLRLSSLEPPEVTPRLLELFSSQRLCRHFHMSIQSACTETLKQMKRQYTADDVQRSLVAIQKHVPGAFIGMDVIAGFSGESDSDFAETYARLDHLPWTKIHVFPYSERHGTRAARREDQVPIAVRRARARRLRELSSQRYTTAAQNQVGETKQVLMLRNAQGLSRDYWPLSFAPQDIQQIAIGSEFLARVNGFDGELRGVVG